MYVYKWYHYVLIIILLVFQPFLAEWFSFGNVSPDFLIIFIILAALNKTKSQTILIAVAAGFTYDLLYTHLFFQYVLVLCIAVLSVWMISAFIKIENVIYVSVYGVIITYILSIMKSFFEIPFHQIISHFNIINMIAVKESLISGIIYFAISLVFFIISVFSVSKVTNTKGAIR
ncbi:MAG: rod shape-determining protein MreD [Clostridia bacterium]|nr:rod shape-determining protein MreD [Clostridia bacterium]